MILAPFHFTICIKPSTDSSAGAGGPNLGGMPILIVDGNFTSRRLLTDLLGRWRALASYDAVRYRELHIFGCLTKPLRRHELSAMLSAILSGRAPFSPEYDQLVHQIPAPPTSTMERDSGRRILLAEDDPVNQRLALRLLEKEGHFVVVAANGKEAFKQWLQQPFDLILMDVQMPSQSLR